MMRQLNLNEMEMVSGGEDVVVGTATQTSGNGATSMTLDEFNNLYGNTFGGGLSHGGLGVFGQFGGGGGGNSTPEDNENRELPDCHALAAETQSTLNATAGGLGAASAIIAMLGRRATMGLSGAFVNGSSRALGAGSVFIAVGANGAASVAGRACQLNGLSA